MRTADRCNPPGTFQCSLSRDGLVSSPDVQFFGKWVVLEGGHVVASGSNPKQLYEDVRANGISSPFLIYVSADRVSADRISPNVQEHFAGGWID